MTNKTLFYIICVFFSMECMSSEIPEKTDVSSPWGKFDEFIHLLSTHRETIAEKITYPDVCDSIVDEFIQGEVKVIHPTVILPSNDDLIDYMNGNAACTDFKIKQIEYIDGSQIRSFEMQPPYYLYKFSLNQSAYVGIMPSGAHYPFNIKTPNIIDFEEITLPYVDLWDVNQCSYVGGKSAPTNRGDFGFGIVISPSRGLLAYEYELDYSHVSLGITAVLKNERENAYCVVSGIKTLNKESENVVNYRKFNWSLVPK
ncbi:hypothetical protein [Shewanella violacea]|uniref:Uncharacterized protein n=1 Tax=Shewanella violacea (strain JCM 10179 / CIP 106290 / LMG 19151 / DSS12) TaxID=637905 RepID=D4ZBF1_SHEVD|nr:hypothetical protein [Shewanella violacea]BAJ03346.1 hypothetical protein SVI_3375 [Shewanella violacea DSS12]